MVWHMHNWNSTERKENVTKNIWIRENFAKLIKPFTHSYKKHSSPVFTPSRMSTNKITPTHITVSVLKAKYNLASNLRKKSHLMHQWTTIRMKCDYLSQKMENRRNWKDIFKFWKKKNCQSRFCIQWKYPLWRKKK